MPSRRGNNTLYHVQLVRHATAVAPHHLERIQDLPLHSESNEGAAYQLLLPRLLPPARSTRGTVQAMSHEVMSNKR